MSKEFEDYTHEELKEIFEENLEFLFERFEETDNPKRKFWMRLFTEVAGFDPAFVARNLECLVAVFSTFLAVQKEEVDQEDSGSENDMIFVDHLTQEDIEEIERRWGINTPAGVELR